MKDEERRGCWDVVKTKSVWDDDTTEFELHLFQLVMRLVCLDYARHANIRRRFSPNPENIPYMYTHTIAAASTLSEIFGKMGLVNGFFMQVGIMQGESHLTELTRKFHFHLYPTDLIKDPPVPDMQMLSFHSTMVFLQHDFNGDMWKFGSHFRRVQKRDL